MPRPSDEDVRDLISCLREASRSDEARLPENRDKARDMGRLAEALAWAIGEDSIPPKFREMLDGILRKWRAVERTFRYEDN